MSQSKGPHEAISGLRQQMDKAIIGQKDVNDALIIALLTNGHVLIEGLPGTAKTRSVKALAQAIQSDLGRIQFTPDLLPSDITGTEIYREKDGHGELSFQPGPIFNNLVLADEINRAPAKVQAALLEAMEERQVTIAGVTHLLPELFMVLATQNPIEHEGTYPLLEAQRDRFLMKVATHYPQSEVERDIVRLVRDENREHRDIAVPSITIKQISEARESVNSIHVSEAIDDYIVALVMATRTPSLVPDLNPEWLEFGSSPRASISLDKAARAHAWLEGKDFVDPDDVRAIVHPVLRHRLALSYEAMAEGVGPDSVIDLILKETAVV